MRHSAVKPDKIYPTKIDYLRLPLGYGVGHHGNVENPLNRSKGCPMEIPKSFVCDPRLSSGI
jgi:hypothetical protein